MISESADRESFKSFIKSKEKTAFLYPVLIVCVWLIVYLLCTVLWDQKIGWDENSYLTTAKGIATDFDFSSRTTTPLGTIKYAFPQHTHHYPIYSTYIAIFFKLFGISIPVAYFSTWLSALCACLFIYFTMLLVTENSRLFSFLTAITFLFLPRVVDYCDSAMMEIPGCGLLMIFTYFIFKDISKGKVNPFLIGLAAAWLYLYKSLFIGAVFGFIALILCAYKSKRIGLNIQSKFNYSTSLSIYLGVIAVIYFIFTKLIFLPLAPMMNFDRRTELLGTYADFAAGFFHDPINNALLNLNGFWTGVIVHYFPSIPTIFIPNNEGFFNTSPGWFEFGLFFVFVFYMTVFFFISFKKLLPLQRLVILFTIVSIFSLNLIFNLIAASCLGVRCRYNLLYLPLLLISIAILLWVNRDYFTPFFKGPIIRNVFLLWSFLLILYVPFYLGGLQVAQWNKDLYHNIAHKNSEIVRKFIGNLNPQFIYFHAGQHTNWDLYPTRVIIMDMSTDQLKLINKKLPKPIDFLFLQPENQLFQESQNLIMKGQPIIDNAYSYYGVDPENKVVVYKSNESYRGN